MHLKKWGQTESKFNDCASLFVHPPNKSTLPKSIQSCQTACFANCGQQGSPSSSSKVQNNYSSSSSTIYVKTIGGYSSSSSLSTVRYTPTYSSTTTTSSSSTTSIASSTSTFSPITQASATSSSPFNSAPVVKPGLTLLLLLSFICGVLV